MVYHFYWARFLGESAELRQATISIAIHFYPPVRHVRTQQLGSHWTDFHEI